MLRSLSFTACANERERERLRFYLTLVCISIRIKEISIFERRRRCESKVTWTRVLTKESVSLSFSSLTPTADHLGFEKCRATTFSLLSDFHSYNISGETPFARRHFAWNADLQQIQWTADDDHKHSDRSDRNAKTRRDEKTAANENDLEQQSVEIERSQSADSQKTSEHG